MISWYSLFFALIAYTLLSCGFVLMKKGISWIGHKGKKDRIYYRNLFTWIGGFIVLNSYIIPNAIALKNLEPHIVSSFAAWGVVVLVFLSKAVLKEQLFRSDYIYTMLIFISITLLNLYEQPKDQITVNSTAFVVLSLFPLLVMAFMLTKWISKKLKAILFAGISGLSTGMIIVSIKALVTLSGFRIGSYFSSLYFYVYLFFSLAAFVTLQISYKLGPMMRVGPVQYGAAIVYPVLCSYSVFGNKLTFIQIASLFLLIFGTIRILKKH
ncbi:MAG: hypothetical protein GF421_10980 [Candidatus Aminicenantes bacterium]|nr:hypothetical protein [Candidatus Aminicenantes bacterium]